MSDSFYGDVSIFHKTQPFFLVAHLILLKANGELCLLTGKMKSAC